MSLNQLNLIKTMNDQYRLARLSSDGPREHFIPFSAGVHTIGVGRLLQYSPTQSLKNELLKKLAPTPRRIGPVDTFEDRFLASFSVSPWTVP